MRIEPPDQFEQRVRDLANALKRLEENQGRVARRNARHAVKNALNRVQADVDASYPHFRKEVTKRRVLTPHDRYRKLTRNGWVQHNERRHPDLTAMNIAGIKVKEANGITLIPDWIEKAMTKKEIEAGNTSMLKRLNKSIRERKARMAANILLQDNTLQDGISMLPF